MTSPSPQDFVCVILESPFAGDRARNHAYLCAAMLDCLQRGEAPFASHGLYTQCLDDANADHRSTGIAAGFAWRAVAKKTVVYINLGISPGMAMGITHAHELGHQVEYRLVEKWDKDVIAIP